MKICVIGTGYVGLVTGACIADAGHQVVCVDKDPLKITSLNKGQMPIHEPGLEQIVAQNSKLNRLIFSTELNTPAMASDVFIIAVGTPPSVSDGRADLSQVYAAADELSRELAALDQPAHKIIMIKCTVPPGTTARVKDKIGQALSKNGQVTFDMVFSPEFLREGSAIKDTFEPDRVILGVETQAPANVLKELFNSVIKQAEPIFLQTDIASAEMIKYASNAFLATKISFINEIAHLCELTGANIDGVAQGLGLDKRIGKAFLQAGLGHGGSCFPKDTRALDHLAGDHGHEFHLLKAVIDVNNQQRKRFLNKIIKVLGGLRNKSIGVLGLSFKPNTDDIRESIALKLIEDLIERGARVRAHDPLAEPKASEYFRTKRTAVSFCPCPYEAAEQAEALIIATEWDSFADLDLAKIKRTMKDPVIFDGRNMFDPRKIEQAGIKYFAVGGHGRS